MEARRRWRSLQHLEAFEEIRMNRGGDGLATADMS